MLNAMTQEVVPPVSAARPPADNPHAVERAPVARRRGIGLVGRSAGGREHFVIMVNPVRVDAIEALVRSIPAAAEGRAAAAMTTDGVGVLRSVGGLARDKTVARASSPTLVWFEEASDLTGQQETANGAWMRRLTVPGASRR
jgi:hypothetical protein